VTTYDSASHNSKALIFKIYKSFRNSKGKWSSPDQPTTGSAAPSCFIACGKVAREVQQIANKFKL